MSAAGGYAPPKPQGAKATGTGKPNDRRVLVALSGRTESAVVAALLKSQGYDVVGVHFTLLAPGQEFGCACAGDAAEAARKICERIGAPFHLVDASPRFTDQVIDSFIHDMLESRLPSPCVRCDAKVRLVELAAKADALGIHHLATGHYAQLVQDHSGGAARLYRAGDAARDQTYELSYASPAILARAMMPLGGIPQTMVAKLARELGLPAPQGGGPGMCWVATEASRAFVESRVAPALRPPGPIRLPDGSIVGHHEGLFRYSIGQDTGFTLSLPPSTDKYRVVGFDIAAHALIVGFEWSLLHKEFWATAMSWIRPVDQLHGMKIVARIRPGEPGSTGRVTIFENDVIHVELDEPEMLVVPGQLVVIEQGDEILGSGFISRVKPYR